MITIISATNASRLISQNAPNAKILISLILKLALHVRKVTVRNVVGLEQELALNATMPFIKIVEHA